MKKDIRKIIDRICQFLNKKPSSELIDAIITHTSFDEMKKNKMTNMEEYTGGKPVFMRKGQVGDWVNYFSEEQIAFCDTQIKEKIKGCGVDLPEELF